MSLLSRLRGRRAHAALTTRLDGEHPKACRCNGRGWLDDDLYGERDCPVLWVAREAPSPVWLVGRIPRGYQR